MQFSKGDSPVEGSKVLFPIKDARNAETYRLLNAEGSLSFMKIFNPELLEATDYDASGQLRELAILKDIHHPGIPELKQTGKIAMEVGDVPYGIYEFVPGETLMDVRRRELVLDPEHSRQWVIELLRAVAYLHERPDVVCHNQIDLTNVMLDSRKNDRGEAMLIDFGHAHQHAIGTDAILKKLADHNPYFLANECFEGAFSPMSDVFSIGAVYYQLAFGLNPWSTGMTNYQAARVDAKEAILNMRSRPLQIPNLAAQLMPSESDLNVIRKALHPDAQHRFQSAQEMLEGLTGGIKLNHADVAPITNSGGDSQRLHGFDAIAGMEELKSSLMNEVLGPIRQPEKYQAYGLTIPNGMLLYGPPGCGKTFISERFAEEAGVQFKKIVPSDLASIYVHGSQEKIGKLFDEARQIAPCILFFDELDALLPSRDSDGINPNAASEVNEFLAQMGSCSEAGVFIMGATNRPKLIDPAVLRSGRLDKKIFVAPPDFDARKAMFILHLANRPKANDIDFDELAHLSEGRVSSDLKLIVDDASRKALFEEKDIDQAGLKRAILETNPSVAKSEIDRYASMRNSFEAGDDTTNQEGTRIGF